jgi:G:T-mismatch repair DNA endonuclease (very short patch repair protein)
MLRALGWDTLTIWECQLKNTEVLRTRLVRFLA